MKGPWGPNAGGVEARGAGMGRRGERPGQPARSRSDPCAGCGRKRDRGSMGMNAHALRAGGAHVRRLKDTVVRGRRPTTAGDAGSANLSFRRRASRPATHNAGRPASPGPPSVWSAGAAASRMAAPARMRPRARRSVPPGSVAALRPPQCARMSMMVTSSITLRVARAISTMSLSTRL